MERSVESLLNLYNPHDPLDKAWTIPSPWYFEPRIAELLSGKEIVKTIVVPGKLVNIVVR